MEKQKQIKIQIILLLFLKVSTTVYAQENNFKLTINDSIKLETKITSLKNIFMTIGEKKIIEVFYWPNKLIRNLIIKQSDSLYLKLGFNYVGNLISQGEYVLYNETLLANGGHLHFTDEGNLSHIYTYKKGKLNGMFKSYYENGILEQSGNYINENKRGKWLHYSKKGLVIKTENYK